MKWISDIGVGVLLSVILLAPNADSAEGFPVVPKPLEMTASGGTFAITGKTRILADDKSRPVGDYLREMLSPATGFQFPVERGSGRKGTEAGAISLVLVNDPDLGDEGYGLTVAGDGVVIRGNNTGGLVHGVQTLLQLLPAEVADRTIRNDIREWTIPCVEIRDRPRFAWRGLMMDCSRTFQSMDYLKKTLDLMAMFKMNVLHLHLTDDQGWRLEIKKYPELTRKGARFPDKWNEPESHNGFYTQDDIRELVAYAQVRNITIVPEIELPGHSLAALACYPELSCTGGPFEIHPFRKGPGIHKDIFCAGNEKTFEFFENVLTEVFELFPSEYIHIGGDEAPKNRWNECPKCQQRIKDEGLRNAHDLQSYFVNRVGAFIEKHGRKFMGWNEILGSTLSPNAGIMSWQGMRGGLIGAASGRPVVMTPTSHCYFDYKYDSIDSQRAYSFEPVPGSVKPEHRKNILGLQANFWSHIDREPHLVDHQLWPRLIAIAERGWSERSVREWEDFNRRLGYQYVRLESMGVRFAVPPLSGLKTGRSFLGQTEVEIFNHRKNMEVFYTLDGSAPTPASLLYTGPITLTESATIKARGFVPDGGSTPMLVGTYSKQELRAPARVGNVSPGLKCEYRVGRVDSLDEIGSLPAGETSVEEQVGLPAHADRNSSFALIFKGYVRAPVDGIYTFYTNSDDGSRLLIGDQVVVENGGTHGAVERSGQIALKEGLHPITVLYFESLGGEALDISYIVPGQSKEPVRASQLFH